MLGIKKCLLCRQKMELNRSEVEGSLMAALNNARFSYKKNDDKLHMVVMLPKSVDSLEASIE